MTEMTGDSKDSERDSSKLKIWKKSAGKQGSEWIIEKKGDQTSKINL
jgi:molybdopterin synthase catalytic subunit